MATERSDVDLVVAIGAGDEDALGALYDRHARWLTQRLHRRWNDADVVDTVVQETFLSVWRSAAAFVPSASGPTGGTGSGGVSGWLWTIAMRRLVDQLRRRHPPEPTATDQLPDPGTDPMAMALDRFEADAALAALDPDLRDVLRATALDGLTTKEAAVLLGIPHGTVKTRLSRARAAGARLNAIDQKEVQP
ncbi:MAG: RNA polymerase sigma factor [Acidimicrobiia bacterium]